MKRAHVDADFSVAAGSVPLGIGLRTPHFHDFLCTRPTLEFVEVHSENFFGRGGQLLQTLDRVRADYALSLHGVGLSLGSAEPVRATHLRQLQDLVARTEPSWVSEHLSWSGIGGVFANDLLPLPYTEESLDLFCANVQRVQDVLRRPLLIENPSRYLAFKHSVMDETEFLAALVQRSGCGLLLDINNVHVSAVNLGFDAADYLRRIAVDAVADTVAEIHLAGHAEHDGLLLDTHGHPVAPPVWQLYEQFIAAAGTRPTLIEWDTDLPALSVLLGEADKAAQIASRNARVPA